MFCACNNQANGSEPNTKVCPICLGHPGTLPVPNREAIDWAIKAGLALHCKINRSSKFDRKNYFYPDLPKGYQISQYDEPLCYEGYLDLEDEHILITRLHLEEDTGKSTHPQGADHTLIDFNRAGTPLIELVTEPVIKDAATAKKFCQAYQQILRYLDISGADMEKGEMRCEANVSLQAAGNFEYRENAIKPLGDYRLNNKVEVKNINSFRSLERAIAFEIARQEAALERGEEIIAETRGWNDDRNETVSQRVKESSADYRYFPEPDIPPLNIDDNWIARIESEIPEMPAAKKERFIREYRFNSEVADTLVADKRLADWTENVLSELDAWIEANGDEEERQERRLSKTAGNWITSELLKHLKADNKRIDDLSITAENFAELIALVYQGKINSSAGQRILEEMYNNGGDPTDIMRDLGLEQLDDSAELEKTAQAVIDRFPEQTQEYRQGKTPLIRFFLGQMMADTRGKANPQRAQELLEKLLTK